MRISCCVTTGGSSRISGSGSFFSASFFSAGFSAGAVDGGAAGRGCWAGAARDNVNNVTSRVAIRCISLLPENGNLRICWAGGQGVSVPDGRDVACSVSCLCSETSQARSLPSGLVCAGRCVDAGIGKHQPGNWAATHDVLFDDLIHVSRSDTTVPDGLGIDDDVGPVLALVKAACLVGTNAPAQTALGQLALKQLLQLGAAGRIAAAARMTIRPLIAADKNVVGELWHGRERGQSSALADDSLNGSTVHLRKGTSCACPQSGFSHSSSNLLGQSSSTTLWRNECSCP